MLNDAAEPLFCKSIPNRRYFFERVSRKAFDILRSCKLLFKLLNAIEDDDKFRLVPKKPASLIGNFKSDRVILCLIYDRPKSSKPEGRGNALE